LRGQAAEKKVPPGKTGVQIDAKQRALVDVRADPTPELRKKLEELGSVIVSTSLEYHSVVAWIPLLKLEQLAEDKRVHSVEPPTQATTQSDHVDGGLK
jgi:hypothetical protein